MDKISYLKQLTVITKADIKRIIGCNDDYAYTYLNRLLKRKVLQKIIKGKYTACDDIYAIASSLHFPSYISFWSCSYFKGYTEQIVNIIHLASTKNYKSIEFNNYKIEFHKLSKKLFFGYEKTKAGNNFILIADDEKLLIDCLLFQNNIGNPDEIIKILQNININQKKLISYLKRINNLSLNKRIGFLLEKFKSIDISKKITFKDKNYIDLFIYSDNKFLNQKWRIKHAFN